MGWSVWVALGFEVGGGWVIGYLDRMVVWSHEGSDRSSFGLREVWVARTKVCGQKELRRAGFRAALWIRSLGRGLLPSCSL